MTVRTPHVVKEDKHWLNPPAWWKKYRPLRWIAIATIIGGFGSGIWGAKEIVLAPKEHPQTAQYMAGGTGIALGQGFISYATLDAVLEKLDQAKVAYSVSRNPRPQTAHYPTRDLDRVIVDEYVHMGVPGRMELEFFNNRLYTVSFEPEDAEAYSQRLYASEPRLKKTRQGRSELDDGTLRLSTNVDLARSTVGISLRTKPFALWQDLRLARQLKQWETDFGAMPVPRKKSD